MCWCTPSLRTPCCGGDNCHPPTLDDIVKNAQLSLWQSYCDKKMECEVLKGLLTEASILLVDGTEESCKELSNQILYYLEK